MSFRRARGDIFKIVIKELLGDSYRKIRYRIHLSSTTGAVFNLGASVAVGGKIFGWANVDPFCPAKKLHEHKLKMRKTDPAFRWKIVDIMNYYAA